MPERPAAARRASPARILIADDHEMARAGLRAMLFRERDLEIVGEARTGVEAVALCRRLRPDLVLMDVRMPVLDGLAATRAIKQELPRTSVVVVTTYESPNYLYEALRAGAAGFLLKDATGAEVVGAIRRVLHGESLLEPELAMRLLQRLAGEADVPAAEPSGRLTPRELEVLRMLATGRTNRQIAEALVISPATVKIHVERIIAKLGVSDRTQAAVRALELRLIGLPASGGG